MSEKNGASNKLAMTLLKGRTFIVLIVLLVFFSITATNFLNVDTFLLIGKHVALYGILAIGMTYVIITGGIDLSVGAIAGLGGMIAGGLLQNGLTLKMFGVTLYFSVPMVVLITIVIGALIGVANGLVITKFNVAPFIATLGICMWPAASPIFIPTALLTRTSRAIPPWGTRAGASSAPVCSECPWA